MTFTACTIAARAQLAQARALAWSLRTLDPAVALQVVIVDDRGFDVQSATEPFTIVRPHELDIPRFEMLAAIHALPELIEVLRPAVLRQAIDQARGPVLMLDVDMLAYASLEQLFEAARRQRVALVPRLLAAVPRDHIRLSDEDVIKRGVFDQGICAMSPGDDVDHLLRLWSDRTELDLGNERPLVSARFLDLVPGIVPGCAIVRDPGLGLSVLNLHERGFTGVRPYCVNGHRLRLVHFTGIDGRRRPPDDPFTGPLDRRDPPEHDWERSPDGLREQLQRDLLAGNPTLGEIVAARDDAVTRVDAIPSAPQYRYARLADGTPLGRRLRRAIRDAELYGGLTGSPFTAAGTIALLEWLNGPGERGAAAGITRYWFEIYRERPDVQVNFPDLDGGSAGPFLSWVARTGRDEYATPDSLIPSRMR